MSDSEKKPSQSKASASTRSSKGPNDTLQAAFDEANAKGYFGTTPDETPNADYTVAGVTKGKK